ncbi:unnamed protein product [Sordaria macrospora k-hell]|uniref:WGS project CABT00000000 data, contig 2.191 n=1 Tax=Sordaria macrospora (strain ATCC MYA-333 / DSM 997 / K(L3346) / K-hell) TaxID=771870 RepID=F7WCQ2_SORMK|nr:unnamed protein product [Sordaria macrospora k-hell]
MNYTQTAFTGRTGARPITALTRELTRRMKVVDESAVQISKQDARRVVKALKGAIAVSNGAIETLMDLVQLTWEADWAADRPLVVWPSNQHLADEVRKTVACIKARLRELRAAGLILARDSASGRRSGFRNRDGVIVEAYGLDLSPIRLRYAELKEAGDRLNALYALFKSGKKEIARVRRIVGQALAQAADLSLTGPHWMALQDAIDEIAFAAAQARTMGDREGYQAALDRLPGVEDLVGETIDRFMFTEENNPSGSSVSPDIHIQTIPSENTSSLKVRPCDLAEMFPTTSMYLTEARPRWPDVHNAAARLRHDLGIRSGTWVDAIDTLGRDGAAVAVMITAEREARNEIRLTAGAYYAGMVARAKRGELDLQKSLWGFRTERMAAH